MSETVSRSVGAPVARITWPASWLGNPMTSCGVLECRARRLDYRRFCAAHAHAYDLIALETETVVLAFPGGGRIAP